MKIAVELFGSALQLKNERGEYWLGPARNAWGPDPATCWKTNDAFEAADMVSALERRAGPELAVFLEGERVMDESGTVWTVWEDKTGKVMLYNLHGAVTVKPSISLIRL